MSYLDKLLEGAEVEWKTLGEVYSFQYGKGNTIPTSGGDYPVYGSNGIVGSHSEYNSEDSPVIGHIGAYAGIINWAKGKHFVTYNGIICRKTNSNVDSKYAYYILLLQDFINKANKASQPFISYGILTKCLIPIPPLSIQQEIVRILDTFTELTNKITAELTSELTTRKQQYEYYREQLLTFEDDIDWKPLEEVFNLKNGYTPSKSNQEYWKNGTVPWFRMEDIRTNGRILNKSIQYVNSCAIKGSMFAANSIIVATSATIGEHALITVPFLSNQRFTNLSLKSEYDNKFIIKFLFYYGFILNEWCKKNVTVSNFAGVDMSGFKKILIPIPPLVEQERIVGILDKFDNLSTSISEGLVREIELRKQQYEYYRDMLLTFPQDNSKS